MIENVADIHRLCLGDKITFDGNAAVLAVAGFIPTYGGGSNHIIGIKRFVTSGVVGSTNIGRMPYDGANYDYSVTAYDTIFDDGTNGIAMIDEGGGVRTLEITATYFTEGEYYLLVIDSSGTPISGTRTIENASLIYIAHKELPLLGGAPTGVDMDALERLVSLAGSGVRFRDFTFENGYLASNEMAVFNYDDANLLSLDLADIDDDTYLNSTYQASRVINQLGDESQVTTTKDP